MATTVTIPYSPHGLLLIGLGALLLLVVFLADLWAVRVALKGIQQLKARAETVFRIAQRTHDEAIRRLNELENAMGQVTGTLGITIVPLAPPPKATPQAAAGTPPAEGFEHLHGEHPEMGGLSGSNLP